MGSYLRSGLILMAFALVVALILSGVYLLTLDPISQAELREKLAAIKTILSDDQGLMIDESQVPKNMEELDQRIWKSSDEGILFESAEYRGSVASPAYAFYTLDGRKALLLTASSIGYGGDVTIIASFLETDESWQLYRIEILDFSQETPGLGAKIADQTIKSRFSEIPQSGLISGVFVDQDSSGSVGRSEAQIQNAKQRGIILTSDVMTGATITARAVANAINTMTQLLASEGKVR